MNTKKKFEEKDNVVFDISKSKTKEQIKNILDYTVVEYRNIIKQNPELESETFSSCVICCNMLQQKDIESDVFWFNNRDINYHYVIVKVIEEGEQKFYILDPLFRKKIENCKILRLRIENNIHEKEIINQLVNFGYIECTKIGVNLYFDALLEMIEKIENKKRKFDSEQYFKQLVLKCFNR